MAKKGSHKGWMVHQVGASLVARALDPGTKKYKAKSFRLGERAAAGAWARDKHAEFRLRLDRIGSPVAAVGWVAKYGRHLLDNRRVERHVEDVVRILAGFVAAVPDLSDGRARNQVVAWWNAKRWRVAPKAAVLDGVDEPGVERAAATRNRYLSAVRGFCAWLVASGVLVESPVTAAGIKVLRLPGRVKPQFTLPELRAMVAAGGAAHLLPGGGDPYHLRCMLALYAGLRASEVLGLTRDAWDAEGGVLLIRRGKGDKDRLVPVQPDLAIWLTAATVYSDGHFFSPAVRQRRRKYQRRDLDAFCRRCGFEAGDRSPHSLRHSYAGLMTATGVPSLLLAAYMGHTSVATTAGYAQMAARYAGPCTGWPRGVFCLSAAVTT